jgi:Rap1a immunity proteins
MANVESRLAAVERQLRFHRLVIAGLLMPLFIGVPTIVWGMAAAEMASNCKVVVEAPVHGDQIALPDDVNGFLCWGAFLAIQQAVRYFGPDGHPFFLVCVPAEGRLQQLIAIFENFVRAHPEQAHEDFFKIAILALRKPWPCSAPG